MFPVALEGEVESDGRFAAWSLVRHLCETRWGWLSLPLELSETFVRANLCGRKSHKFKKVSCLAGPIPVPILPHKFIAASMGPPQCPRTLLYQKNTNVGRLTTFALFPCHALLPT